MIIQILFSTLVIIWTLITIVLIGLLIKYRKSLTRTYKTLQVTQKKLFNDTQQFDQLKRTIEEFQKISQRIKK
jgi:hypothetical protein